MRRNTASTLQDVTAEMRELDVVQGVTATLRKRQDVVNADFGRLDLLTTDAAYAFVAGDHGRSVNTLRRLSHLASAAAVLAFGMSYAGAFGVREFPRAKSGAADLRMLACPLSVVLTALKQTGSVLGSIGVKVLEAVPAEVGKGLRAMRLVISSARCSGAFLVRAIPSLGASSSFLTVGRCIATVTRSLLFAIGVSSHSRALRIGVVDITGTLSDLIATFDVVLSAFRAKFLTIGIAVGSVVRLDLGLVSRAITRLGGASLLNADLFFGGERSVGLGRATMGLHADLTRQCATPEGVSRTARALLCPLYHSPSCVVSQGLRASSATWPTLGNAVCGN